MNQKAIDIAKFCLIVIGVVALGLLAVNQFMDYRFKNYFLLDPCGMCAELNPHKIDCLYPKAESAPIDYGNINFSFQK